MHHLLHVTIIWPWWTHILSEPLTNYCDHFGSNWFRFSCFSWKNTSFVYL